MDIDKPLEQLVSESKKSKRGSGRRGTGAQRGKGSTREKYAGAVPTQKGQAPTSTGKNSNRFPTASKVVVSNLPFDVTQSQLQDLFSSTIGPVQRCFLAFNENGKSTGVATIEFKKPEHATAAFQQYNGRKIDQTRPMKVEIVVDPGKQTLADRVGPAPKPVANAASVTTSTRGTGRRGRGGRASTGGSKRGEKPTPATAASLDAEMDAFMNTKETA